MNSDWNIYSWRNFTVKHQPTYGDANVLKNTEDQDIKNKDWFSEIDISPKASASLWQPIQIDGVKDIKNGEGGPGGAGEERVDLASQVFSLFGDIDQAEIRASEEEYYVAHEIINPLVEEAIITLQINELTYIYEGDSIEVTYKIGALWTFVMAAWGIYEAAKYIIYTSKAASNTAAAAAAGVVVE